MRSVSAGQQAILEARNAKVVIFVEMALDVTQRFCSARETLTWNGFPWLGIGGIAGVERLKEDTTLEISTLQFTISAVPVEIIALVEAEPIYRRECKVWFGFYGDDYKLVGEPVLEYKGRIDIPISTESPMRDDGVILASMKILVEHPMAFGLRPKVRRRTDADHQIHHPGDRIFQYVGRLGDAIGWGRG